MEYHLNLLLQLVALVMAVSSLGYDRMDLIRDQRRTRTGSRVNMQRNLNRNNNYINGLVNNVGSNRLGASDCYDRCYDVYVTGLRRNVQGCTCSRFDFRGNRVTNRVSNPRYTLDNCNCPQGTVCETQFGSPSTTCYNPRTNRVVSQGQGYGDNARRVFVHNGRGNNFGSTGNGRVNLGVPGSRRIGGHCGYLTPACLSSQTDANQVLRYTYSYQLGTCVREHVYLSCQVAGSRNNLFASRQGCVRTCI